MIGEPLRGDPTALKQALVPKGYFGKLYTDDPEIFATELSTGVFNVAGRMAMDIPTIVPTLNRQELVHLVEGGRPTWGIIEKAKAHAEARISVGKSPFADRGEQHALPQA